MIGPSYGKTTDNWMSIFLKVLCLLWDIKNLEMAHVIICFSEGKKLTQAGMFLRHVYFTRKSPCKAFSNYNHEVRGNRTGTIVQLAQLALLSANLGSLPSILYGPSCSANSHPIVWNQELAPRTTGSVPKTKTAEGIMEIGLKRYRSSTICVRCIQFEVISI